MSSPAYILPRKTKLQWEKCDGSENALKLLLGFREFMGSSLTHAAPRLYWCDEQQQPVSPGFIFLYCHLLSLHTIDLSVYNQHTLHNKLQELTFDGKRHLILHSAIQDTWFPSTVWHYGLQKQIYKGVQITSTEGFWFLSWTFCRHGDTREHQNKTSFKACGASFLVISSLQLFSHLPKTFSLQIPRPLTHGQSTSIKLTIFRVRDYNRASSTRLSRKNVALGVFETLESATLWYLKMKCDVQSRNIPWAFTEGCGATECKLNWHWPLEASAVMLISSGSATTAEPCAYENSPQSQI